MPCINLSTTLVSFDADRWQTLLDEAHNASKLAQQTQTRFLRIFGGGVPKDRTRIEARDLAIRHLKQVIKVTQQKDCIPILETHDDWATSDEVLEILEGFSPDEVGVLWDIEHPFRKGESPIDTATRLSKYIKHIHIKDSVRIDGKSLPKLLGEGELKIDDFLAALQSINYSGWYSLETEKRWHPEGPEPEQSIPQFVEYMSARLK